MNLQQAALLIPTTLRNELTRSPLLQRIEEASDSKIVALLAPSGFGKTTLLSQYARATTRPIAWLTLSEKDADPAVLAHSLARSLKAAFGSWLDHWLPAPATGAEQLGLQMAELLSAFDQNIGIVLDGIHYLGTSASEWLDSFISRLEEGHQVLLAGYSTLALRLTRWVTLGQATVISSAELSFTAAESEVYLRTVGYSGNPAEAYRALEGWPAGLALAASSASQSLTPEALVFDAMALLSPEVQAGLPEAAVVPLWSEQLVRRMTTALPAGWLEAIRRAGLPMTPLQHGIYRPHNVLVSALDQLLMDDPDRYAALHTQAGQQAERAGEKLQALRHYQRAGQSARALDLAATLVPQWMRRMEYGLVREALAPFERSELPQQLAVFLSLALLDTGEAKEGEAILTDLQRLDQPSALLHYALANFLVRRGQLQLALDHVHQGLALPEVDAIAPFKLLRLQAYLYVSLNRPDLAVGAAQQAVDHATILRDLFEQASSLTTLASIYLSTNCLRSAEQATEQAIAIYDQLEMPAGATGLYNDLAQIYRLTDRPAEAIAVLQQVSPAARRDRSRYLPALLETLADVYLWQGDAASAVTTYEEAAQTCEMMGNRLLQVRVRYKLTDALRRAGRAEEARKLLQRLRMSMHHEDAQMKSLPPFFEGLQAFASGEFPQATAFFQEVLHHPVRPDRAARAIAYRLDILRQQDQLREDDVHPLKAQLELLGSDAIFRGEPDLHPLYQYCRDCGWLGTPSTSSNLPLASIPRINVPQVLRLETLGRFHLSIDDQPLRVTVNKVKELLVWLALEGPSSRDRIIDALWDGSNEYRHVEYFKVTVRRLRAVFAGAPMLVDTPLVYENNEYRLAEHLQIEVDVQCLHDALRRRDFPALRQHLESARGSFLSEIDAAWAERWRAQAQAELFTAAIMLAADTHASSGAVCWAFERAISLDPLAREGHEGLIMHLQDHGEMEAARLAYKTYERMLEQEFGEQVPEGFRQQIRVFQS